MLQISLEPYHLTIHESLGLAHESQVVEIPLPAPSPALFSLRDETSGLLYPVQSSRRKPGHGFLLLSVAPDAALSLVPAETAAEPQSAVAVTETGDAWIVKNGNFEIELSPGNRRFDAQLRRESVSGPVRRMRAGAGPWRGRTFFDTANAPLRESAEWLERGPLRTVYHYRIEFAAEGFYDLVLTVDAALDFARLDETFGGAAADQIVWDFSGADLPDRLSLLDSSAGYTAKWLHYHLDQRHARLWCWTQFSQLHDLSDGFALHFNGSDDVIGVVTLEGGKWSGNALNHLEAWTRRWQVSDSTTRRLPGEAKADSFPGIDSIPARGQSINEPHFTLEGWLRQGRRSFALVLSSEEKIRPAIDPQGARTESGASLALEHFEAKPRRDVYSLLQGRLRKIHIQHGMLPLQDQLGLAFDWPLEPPFTNEAPALDSAHLHAWEVGRTHHPRPEADDPHSIRLLDDSLQARVYGFWEGSGASYSNCVVSRRVGPDMLHFEKLAAEGKLSREQITRWRAWNSFMAHVYHSDNFYPGPSSMEPIGSPNSMEPTITGMANQNFYTDVITLAAFAGQVFPGHPSAKGWRDKFLVNWRRQLEYHMFPESGVWEESHTYYQHVLATVLPLFLRRKADGTDDEFAHPAVQKLVAGAIPQMTPRNAVTGGMRHIVPYGDHGVEPAHRRGMYRELARALAPHAPVLAGNLAWVYQEMQGGEISAVSAVAPEFTTGYLAGLGFFFRGGDGAGGESLLTLRSGMAWGHHHHDDGSIQFYARGQALIVDSASGQPQERGERKVQASGHSRATVDGIDPMNYFWRFNRGWILESNTGPDFTYAVAGTPTFAMRPMNSHAVPLQRAYWELRAVVELAPAVYLIADYLDTFARHTVRFHIAHSDVVLAENRVSASFEPNCRLEIVPLFAVAPPTFSYDRPVNAEKVPQENTTSVEYGSVTSAWSLFVVAAMPANDRLEVSSDANACRVTVGGVTATVEPRDDHLIISGAGGNHQVDVDARLLLAKLRAGSR